MSESTQGSSAEKEIHLEETKLSNYASTSETGRDDKESVLNALRNELEHACRSLTLAEHQCDEAVEKAQSLTLEVEMLHAQINQLQEVGAEQTQKYQSLVLELESVGCRIYGAGGWETSGRRRSLFIDYPSTAPAV